MLNLKRKQVEDFINERYAAADWSTVERELEEKRQEIIETASKLGATAVDNTVQLVATFRDTPLDKQFLHLEKKANAERITDELQTSVYNDLYTFFSRHY